MAFGAFSLVNNTVAGVLGAAGSITQGVGKGLSLLSDDAAPRRLEPAHVGEGLVSGAVMLGFLNAFLETNR